MIRLPDQQLQNRIQGKTVFITGSGKNAGKTTLLKYLLPEVRKKDNPIFLSIGIDGERTDRFYGNLKPRIRTEPGDIVVSSTGSLKASDGNFTILEVFPPKTAVGKIAIAETQRGGFIELTGPEFNVQLKGVLRWLGDRYPGRTILIDGAINRLTQVSTGSSPWFIHVVTIERGNLKLRVEEIERIIHLSQLPVYRERMENRGEGESHFPDSAKIQVLPGALTLNTEILEDTGDILVQDFTRIFLSLKQLNKLTKTHLLFVRDSFRLLGVQVNLKNIDQEDFFQLLPEEDREKIVLNPYSI